LEAAIIPCFGINYGSWEISYEILPSLLAGIQNSTYDTKYIIETSPSIKFGVEIFNHVAWAFEIFDLMFSDWVSFLAYPNLFGIKGFVVVVVVAWAFGPYIAA
jgi:hypothetical protein